MQTLLIPASYDVWLTGLKLHLDRYRGSKAGLARYLEAQMGIQFTTAQVKVSQLLGGSFTPSASTFLDIAAWLQRQQDALNDPPAPMPLPDPIEQPLPPRKDVTYRTPAKPAQVAEDQARAGK